MLQVTSSAPRLAVLVFAACATAASPAAEFDATKLAAIKPRMQRFVDEKQVSGLVYAVGNSQGVVAEEALGLATIDGAKPMAKETLFRIASMTKPLTAVGIMILQDEAKLSVDDPVEKHLPEFRGQLLAVKDGDRTYLQPPARPITIRDLLTHTSGVANFPIGLADIYATRNRTLAEMTLVVSQLPLQYEPGSRWSYCNPGIDTLGRIIEVVSGKPYEQFMTERIFTPLGMTNTTYYPTPEQLQRSASLYNVKDGELVEAGFGLLGPVEQAKHPIPAGGLFATAHDLAQAYRMMLGGGKLGETRILSEAAVKQMTALQTGDLECGFTPGTGFGFGWAVVKQPQGVHAMLSQGTFGHGGAFGTQGWIDPQQDLFVILLIQRVGLPNADASDLRRELQEAAVAAKK